MKKFVVEVEVNGRRSVRLIPARNEHTAVRYCSSDSSKVISCRAYTGQKIPSRYDISIEQLFNGCIAANRRKGRVVNE